MDKEYEQVLKNFCKKWNRAINPTIWDRIVRFFIKPKTNASYIPVDELPEWHRRYRENIFKVAMQDAEVKDE